MTKKREEEEGTDNKEENEGKRENNLLRGKENEVRGTF